MSQTVTLDEFQAHEVRVALTVCQYDLQENIDYCDPTWVAEMEARIGIMQEVLDLIEVTYPNYQLIEKRTKETNE